MGHPSREVGMVDTLKPEPSNPERWFLIYHLVMKHANPLFTDALLLDNPIWHALSTEQSALAQGNGLAKRFPSDVAPFGGLIDQSAVERCIRWFVRRRSTWKRIRSSAN